MTEKPVIEIDHVTKIFGDYLAVDNAHFSIEKGEFFSMLGPSGCGKTTTLRMIAGFDMPSEGCVRLSGKDVSQVPPYKRNVNTVFQNYALFPHMTVLKNIMFGLKIKGIKTQEAQARAKEMLEIVKLEDYSDRKPAQLSGGQQQRVALARALVNMPEALLLDEPLAALDLKLRQAMQFELKRIQREVGITFIFVTHDQHEALTMSDRIAVMSKGKVEQIGTPVEIYETPATRFVAGFIGDANLLNAKVKEVNAGSTLIDIGGESILSSSLADDLSNNDNVTVMIRPERIIITLSSEAKPINSLTCTVVSHTFQGAQSRYEMKTKDGQSLFAYVDWTDELPVQEFGTTVYISCNDKSVRTFLNN